MMFFVKVSFDRLWCNSILMFKANKNPIFFVVGDICIHGCLSCSMVVLVIVMNEGEKFSPRDKNFT